ncbi:MAG: AsnC family protein [Gammaproteobacteria bacterium]|nr:AsnC family protein [Gammaproteobacteria bacterium]MBU1655898.1 AsnC family protein [Gammaproteobacteria bacterium]MBU1961005.1 AsnC family protein [Gammaproteobacteria bacterium]
MPWERRPELDDPVQQALIRAIESGLPLVARPYAQIGEQLRITEEEVIHRIQLLMENDLIKRMGVVVRHGQLGYKANAMVVWDIPDERVVEIGRCFSHFPFITLCYSRPRRLPQWRYNLFTMIHGRGQDEVRARIETLADHCALDEKRFEVLFSRRCFKQRGARYASLRNEPDPLK